MKYYLNTSSGDVYMFINKDKNNKYELKNLSDDEIYKIEEDHFKNNFMPVVDNNNDNINPKHYIDKNPEPIIVIENWSLDYHLGNVIKYISRWREKNGIEDLKKALWYLQRKIQIEENVE